MIECASALDVARLLGRVRSRADKYSDLLLCSPFIDDETIALVGLVAEAASNARCRLEIITAQQAVDRVKALLTPVEDRQIRLIGCPRLHAKFYVAVGRREEHTEAIITSTNLTAAGLTRNIELGVRIAATTPHGRTMLDHLDRFARRLAHNRRFTWRNH
jgi:HKD family nuclease